MSGPNLGACYAWMVPNVSVKQLPSPATQTASRKYEYCGFSQLCTKVGRRKGGGSRSSVESALAMPPQFITLLSHPLSLCC